MAVVSREGTKVGVVGGGLSGLFLAELLVNDGWDVEVLENDEGKDSREQGTCLDLSGAVQRALSKTRMWGKYKEISREGSAVMRFYQGDKAVLTLGVPWWARWAIRESPETNRKALRECFLELLGDKVHWNCRAASLHFTDTNKVHVVLPDGSHHPTPFDVVIDASGIRAALRHYVFSDPHTDPTQKFDRAPYFAGGLYHGIIPSPETACPAVVPLVKEGSMIAVGTFPISLQRFGASSDDKSTSIYAFSSAASEADFRAAPGFTNPPYEITAADPEYAQLRGFLHKKMEDAGTGKMYHEAVDAAEKWYLRGTYCFPENPEFAKEKKPQVVIIGDALHAVPPWSGEGGNLALLDSFDVFTCLRNNVGKPVSALHASIEATHKKMLARSAPVASESHLTQKTLMSTEPLTPYSFGNGSYVVGTFMSILNYFMRE